jgi:ankyrin repeat protein
MGQDDSPSSARNENVIYYAPVSSSPAPDKKFMATKRAIYVRTLLQWGADPTLKDRSGNGAIHICVRENEALCLLEILRFIEKKKISSNLNTPYPGESKQKNNSSAKFNHFLSILLLIKIVAISEFSDRFIIEVSFELI